MAYEKQTWTSGDVITAAKMNHIEDGIAAGGSSSGSAIILYLTSTVPSLDDLSSIASVSWRAANDNQYASLTPSGTPLTYTEIKNIYDQYKSGAAVFISESYQDATNNSEMLYKVIESSYSTFSDAGYYAVSCGFTSYDLINDSTFTVTYSFTGGGLQ